METITLTVANAIAFSKIQERTKGRAFLQTILKIRDEDDNETRTTAKLDLYYDTIMFMVKKGFPWKCICSLFECVKESFEETIDKTVLEAVEIFRKNVLKFSTNTSKERILSFSDYFFNIFIKQFRLYSYVFTKPQDDLTFLFKMGVEAMPEPLPLECGKPLDVFYYDDKWEVLQQRHKEKMMAQELKRQQVIEKNKKLLEEDHRTIAEMSAPLDDEKIKKIIESVLHAQLSATTDEIKMSINEVQEEFIMMFEKTTLPRPQILGEPPRYLTKPALQSAQSVISTTESRKSASKSAKKK